MEFMIDTLGYCFDIEPADAAKLMLNIHANGSEVVAAA